MKSKTTALLLTFLLGALGAGNFYLGNMKSGVAQLILFVLGFFTLFIAWIPLGIWILVDLIKLFVTPPLKFDEKYNNKQINN